MIFGNIEYINLLPFKLFLKRSKYNFLYKNGTPAQINKKFKQKSVDAAFISTVKARNVKTLPLGIVAYDEVKSVLIKLGQVRKDKASATSNVLAKILKLNGEVVIGDRALKLFLEDRTSYIDLAKQWNKKYDLPFVFATLAYNGHGGFLKSFTRQFKGEKIPYYMLSRYSKKSKISKKDILDYLQLITYKIGYKEKQSIKKFYKEMDNISH